ncbi:copper amine oxidase N-terminal domain-containing protein [Paenibacillus chartarius]|uniref:Copper amine oxidase N-terminal domain-containing protein n=1 Tax=Paenibacillus chartarius TaxID=747481 RepID=A0ABV6DKA7_9BACL
MSKSICWRKVLAWMGCLLLIAGAILSNDTTATAAEQPIQVQLDLQTITFEIDPLLEDGVTLVQLRPLFEATGIELTWNGESRTITGKKNNETLLLTIDSNKALVNGNEVMLEKAARIVDGNTLVPLRFVGEATGAVVAWHGDIRTIEIISEAFLKELGITKEQALVLLDNQDGTSQQTPPADAPQSPPQTTIDKGQEAKK